MKAWLTHRLDLHSIASSVIGVSSLSAGYGVSLVVVEAWLKVASIALGIVVTLFTLWMQIERRRRHKINDHRQTVLFNAQMRRANAGLPAIAIEDVDDGD